MSGDCTITCTCGHTASIDEFTRTTVVPQGVAH